MLRRLPLPQAFTLLEMLVALALMGMLATALYASLRTGIGARKSAVAAVESVRTLELAHEIVRRDLEAALAPRGLLAGAFIGEDAKEGGTDKDADTLTWHAAVGGPRVGASDIVRVGIALATPETGSQRVLVRSVVRNLLSPTEQEPDEEVLARGVASLNLRYFDGSTWLDAWDSTTEGDTLPLAVEVTMELELAAGKPADAAAPSMTRIFGLPCARGLSTGETRVRGDASW